MHMGQSVGTGSAILLAAMAAGATAAGCRQQALSDQEQIGASVGEVMASADESTNGSGATAAALPPVLRLPKELRGPAWRRALDSLEPSAYAASCGLSTFSSCASGVRTRTFDGCSLGAATLAGSVTLTFSDTAACGVSAVGDSVNRMANFTLTGPYGGTLQVSSPGGGQTLTRTAAGFDYAVPGMERVLVGPGGHTLFDIATSTTTPISITGTSRANLVIVSGALVVTHKLAGYSVTLQPHNLTWTATCNCAVSGSLTGTVSGGKKDGKTATVELTGCGQAEVTIDGDSESVTLDRCVAL
jgi:hypothetical protein